MLGISASFQVSSILPPPQAAEPKTISNQQGLTGSVREKPDKHPKRRGLTCPQRKAAARRNLNRKTCPNKPEQL